MSPLAQDLAAARAAVLAGDADTAVQLCYALSQSSPHEAEVFYWFAAALLAAGEPEAAGVAMGDARTFHALAAMRGLGVDMARFQTEPQFAANLARELYGARMVGLASIAFGRAMSHLGMTQDLLLQYGLSLQHQGRAEESIEVFRAATEAFPSPQVHEFLLFALFYGEDGVHRYPPEARQWAERWAPTSLTAAVPPVVGKRLRLGYVAPSFTRSQLSQFVMPVLAAHDRRTVELFLYTADAAAEAPLPDHATVREIGRLPDADAAALVRADRLDVLVDLWGHTAGSRLTLFTHRPAAVQVGWINFNQTTGMDCIDYVLHADSMDAPGTDALFTETVWRLGPITVPFRGAEGRPPTAPTPALRNGYVTFASFNHPAKLSDQTVAAWSRILANEPTSKLILKYGYFVDPTLQRATQMRFAAHGAAPERISFRGHTTGAAYLAEFADVDLALDPSPCTGGTTTCEALSNGVPVLTLKGADFFARIGLQGLLGIGMPDLIADDWDAYVAAAKRLTHDAQALNALRMRVRPAFDDGPYGDFEGFTRGLERQYRAMVAHKLEQVRPPARAAG